MSKERSQRRTWRDVARRVVGTSRFTPKQRRRLLVVGIVVFAITLFVAIPAYVALQPKFFQRFSSLDKYVKTWSTSVHAEVPCQSCHTSPRFAAQASYDARMVGEFYLSILPLSRQPKLQGVPGNDTCNGCHIDLRTVSPAGDLRIPHKAHVEVLKIKCVDCHESLVHSKNRNGNHAPTMEMCLKCHNGTKAKKECVACHTRKALPEDHRAKDWTIIHSEKKDQVDCTKCHGWTANWCAECHSRRPKSHGTDWRSKHRLTVKIRRNCEICHAGSFCVRCHGEVPSLNFDPALKIVK